MTTLTKNELAKRMRKIVAPKKLSVYEAVCIVEALTDLLIKHFEEGGDKAVLQGFGTFKIRDRKEYETRHPISGEEMTVAAGRSITFKPAAEVKRRLNK
jgi:nucleoid DNA-binding protein